MSEKKTRQVVVGGVETKSSPPDAERKWRRYSLKDPDDKFVGSTFSSTVGKFLQDHEGKRIEVDIEEKEGTGGGTLRDILDAREVTSPAPAEASAGPTPAEKHTTTAREVALKAAVEYAPIAGAAGGGLNVEGVLMIADKFLAYIEGREP